MRCRKKKRVEALEKLWRKTAIFSTMKEVSFLSKSINCAQYCDVCGEKVGFSTLLYNIIKNCYIHDDFSYMLCMQTFHIRLCHWEASLSSFSLLLLLLPISKWHSKQTWTERQKKILHYEFVYKKRGAQQHKKWVSRTMIFRMYVFGFINVFFLFCVLLTWTSYTFIMHKTSRWIALLRWTVEIMYVQFYFALSWFSWP